MSKETKNTGTAARSTPVAKRLKVTLGWLTRFWNLMKVIIIFVSRRILTV